MKTELIKISQLKLLERNPRRITKEQMDKLCRSIQNDPTFLECRPVLVNCIYVDDKPYMHVYAGNQRVRAAKKLGMKEIPCVVDYELTEEFIKSRIVKDNAHYGSWDHDILANEYEIEMLLESGLTEKELLGLTDKEEKSNEEKSKKQKECPNCGVMI